MTPLLEIETETRPGHRVKVTDWIFRSWTGPRWIDGEPYVGPRYVLGTDQPISENCVVEEATNR